MMACSSPVSTNRPLRPFDVAGGRLHEILHGSSDITHERINVKKIIASGQVAAETVLIVLESTADCAGAARSALGDRCYGALERWRTVADHSSTASTFCKLADWSCVSQAQGDDYFLI